MKRKIRWLRNRLFVLAWSVFCFIFLFLINLEWSKITNIRYEISYLKEALDNEKRKEQELKIEIAKLSSEERIQELAKKYKLIPAKPKQIVFLKEPSFPEEKEVSYKQDLFAIIFKKNIEAKEK